MFVALRNSYKSNNFSCSVGLKTEAILVKIHFVRNYMTSSTNVPSFLAVFICSISCVQGGQGDIKNKIVFFFITNPSVCVARKIKLPVKVKLKKSEF